MSRIPNHAVVALTFIAIGSGLLHYSSVDAAPFATDVAGNGPTQKVQSAQDLLGNIPRNLVEGQVTGSSSGHVGSSSEFATPLGQFVKVSWLSNGPHEIYVIYDRLNSVMTAQLFGINRMPVDISDPFLGQNMNPYRYVYSGGPSGVWATGRDRSKYYFPYFKPYEPPKEKDNEDIPEPASLALLTLGSFMLLKRKTKQF